MVPSLSDAVAVMVTFAGAMTVVLSAGAVRATVGELFGVIGAPSIQSGPLVSVPTGAPAAPMLFAVVMPVLSFKPYRPIKPDTGWGRGVFFVRAISAAL